MKVKDKLLEMYRCDKVHLAEWLLVIVTGVFVFATSCTWDLQSLTIWSTNVWDCVAEGNFRNLYAYTAENIYHVHHQYMGSELLSVLPWSVWNLPIWAIQRFAGKPIIDSAVMLAYSKLFLVLITVVTLIFTKKLAYLVTGDRVKSTWTVFLTASSTYLFLSVCYSGQNDILMICPSVIALYYLLKNKEKRFLLWSCISIAIKPFFILAFLAVLLLYEKHLLKIIGKTIIAAAGLIAQKLLFMGAPGYAESMNSGPSKQMLEDMFPANLNTNFGGVSFFAIALILIYFYCYTRDFSKEDLAKSPSMFGKYAVYMISVTYAGYLLFSPFSYYRLAVLTPYLYIVTIQNRRMYLFNAIFDSLAQFALLMKMVLRGSKMFEIRFVNKALIQRFFGYYTKHSRKSDYCGVDTWLFRKFDLLEKYQPLFAGVAAVCLIMLLVLNHPQEKVRLPISGDKNVRALLWVRTLIILPFSLLTVYCFAKTALRVYYL